jgi:hypothetical protein
VRADDEPVSGVRVAAIVVAQIAYLFRGVVLILAVPFSLFAGLMSAVGIYTFTRPAEHVLAQIILPASIALLGITILSMVYRQLRTPSAILAVTMVVVIGIVESISTGAAG